MKIFSRFFDNRNVTSRQDLIDSVIIGILLTALSYFVAIEANWISSLNWLEVFSVFTSYSCTYLCVKERRINYPIGAISTAAYTLLFLQAHLYDSALLNAYLTPALIYGWFRWRKDKNTRRVGFVSLKWWPVYVIVAGAAYLLANYLSHQLGGSMAWSDAFILSGTILAQFLLDNKRLENWVIWMAVNGLAIYEYFASHLYLVGFQYAFFFLNTLYGFYVWKVSMNDDRIRVDDSNAADDRTPVVDAIR
jgi:nicotinamide mononucleotide transporter